MAQSDLALLLSQIVDESKGDFKAIIVFDLREGLPMFSNTQLKSDSLYNALFPDENLDTDFDSSDLDTGLGSLSRIQEDLNKFGDITKFKQLQYSIFRLKQGTMMAYFDELPDINVAICFLSPSDINLGNVVFQSRRKVDQIKEAIKRF